MAEAYDSTVSGFLSHFNKGFARQNRYIATFILPPGIPVFGTWSNPESGVGAITAKQIEFNGRGAVNIACHSCTMPGRTMMAFDHVQHSAPFRVPYSSQYAPVNMSFYCNSELRERQFFDIWQTAVVNINDNSMNFFEEYIADVHIAQLDRNGEPTYGVTLYGAYPIMLGDIEYSYGSNDAVVSCPVTLQYKLWKADHDETQIVIY